MYYGLSDTGVRVWELLQAPRTVEAILEALVTEYEVERPRAEADLHTLLADLQSRGLIAITQPAADR